VTGIESPIFSVEQGRIVNVFSSVEAVEGYVEPIDIENGELAFYDAEGRTLVPELVEAPGRKKLWGRLGWVSGGGWRLREPTEPSVDTEALRARLIDFLAEIDPRRTGVAPDELRLLELPRLVELSSRFPTS
jgi:hypothetical protein